jgi:lipoprotein signal peptidase
VFNFRTTSWKKICCAENFVAIVGKLYQLLQYPSEFYFLFKGMVIQTTEEGLGITIHARTLLLQFKESTTLTVGSFDATSVSCRGTFFSRASQSLQWYLVKGNTTLSLPSLFCFYFFLQRRDTTKLSTITRIIIKSFSFTDTRNNICVP